MKTCYNCGHQCHCGSPCMQEHTDGDGKKIEIECCKHCSHDIDIEAETKYDTLDIDSFNGA